MIVERIPQNVRNAVLAHLRIIQTFNAGILTARETEELVGQYGREEYEYRVKHEAGALKSAAMLGTFRQNAEVNGLNVEMLYAELQLSPIPAPWSEAAIAWGNNALGARM